MHLINDWADFLRIFLIVLGLYSVGKLVWRYRQSSNEWNQKTLDYWYSLLMWSAAGVIIAGQGVVLDRPFTPATVLLAAATLVTAKGIHTKGSWGGG